MPSRSPQGSSQNPLMRSYVDDFYTQMSSSAQPQMNSYLPDMGSNYLPYNSPPSYQYSVPQSQRPQYNPAQGVADSINSAFSNYGSGGNSNSFGGGSSMRPQQQYGIVPNYQQPYQSLHSQAIPIANRGAGFLWQGFLNAPGNIAGGINNAFDQYQFYTDRQSERNARQQLANTLLDGIGGLGGGGNRMSGFVDMNSGQAAALPGQTTNAITASALSPAQIAQAAGQARGATSRPAAAVAQRGTPEQASEVDQIAQSAARTRGARNANQIDRTMTAENANLQRAIELAKSRQGLGNAEFLVNLNADNTQRDVALQAPLIRALLSGLTNLV